MPLPVACLGLVFRYEYVWKRQALAGQSVGEKERPAGVVLAITGASGDQRVLIVPITTQPPEAGEPAVAIPPKVKRHLGLDDDRPSWIILSEANIDAWPSPDMRPIPGKAGCFEYGLLPLRLVNQIRDIIAPLLTAKRLPVVDREQEASGPKP